MSENNQDIQLHGWRKQLNDIIFEAETPAGKLFDIVLFWAIIMSVVAVVLESVTAVQIKYGPTLRVLEWFFTILFTIEYILRLIGVRQQLKYVFSFFGIVDLLSILPTYLSLYITGAQTLLVIRGLRLLRIFRVLKLGRYYQQSSVLLRAIKASKEKIVVFLFTVLSIVVIVGTVMYLIEGEHSGFTSIPMAMYWAIVTMTTVGYGDLAPHTPLGKGLASILMLLGYGIIAVPTGIVSAEMVHATQKQISTVTCDNCVKTGHELDAVHCRFCGAKL